MKDERLIAEAAKGFLDTDFGRHFITQLSLIYNGLHQDAEQATTSEAKAFKVERAAGLKMAIDYLNERAMRIDRGDFPKEDAPEA